MALAPLRTPYFELSVVESAGRPTYVRIRRSDLRFPDVAAIEAEFRGNAASLQPYRHLPALIDLRGSPVPTSDPVFEQAVARHGNELTAQFPRVALLVKTAVGSLQVKRVSREVGVESFVFTSEADALEFLLGAG